MAARTLGALLAFVALSSTIVFLAHGQPLPFQGENVSVGTNDTEVTKENPDAEGIEGLFLRTSCILTLGISELTGDACSRGFAGTFVEDAAQAVVRFTAGLGDFVAMMGAIMVFDIPGAPDWVTWAIRLPIIGTAAYITVSLVRGVG